MKPYKYFLQTISIVFLSLSGTILFTQQEAYNQIVSASPTAQTFMSYGEISIDYSTSVPNINIPIYTLEGSKLSLPISISYHASGIKVNDITSEVGLDWILNAGGLITRTTSNIRDERKTGNRAFYNASQLIYVAYTNKFCLVVTNI